MTADRKALLAGLFEVVEAETPYGGRSRTYEPIGSAWLKIGTVRRRERGEAGTSQAIETMTAQARPDPRLTAGRVLSFGGGDWRIVTGATVTGRTLLTLERTR